jgi:hypothetical protein
VDLPRVGARGTDLDQRAGRQEQQALSIRWGLFACPVEEPMAKVRITLEVDETWITQYVTLDVNGAMTFNTDVVRVVSIEQI